MEATHFLEHIFVLKVQEGEDSLAWKNDGRGKFSVESYYKSLRAESNFLFPANEIWGLYAPLRSCFFCLGSNLGKNLNSRHVNEEGMVHGNRCSLCKDNEESANHILIHCDKTKMLWTVLLTSFGPVWVFPNSMKKLLLEWKVKGLRKKKRAVWRLTPICLFWCTWEKQNWRTFQEEEMFDQSLRKLFTCSLLEWSQQVKG